MNLQTKASRAALEQNAEALRQLEEAVADLREPPEEDEEPEHNEEMKPLLKAIVDVYDSLAMASRQVEKQMITILSNLEGMEKSTTIEMPPEIPTDRTRPGFAARWFGGQAPPPEMKNFADWRVRIVRQLKEREQKASEAGAFVKDALDGLMTGYTMGLSRVDRVLTKFGLETIPSIGERFDPELMEVVEAVPNTGKQLGEVIEEVRRGYRRDGAIFRYAQVRVAR